MRELNAKVKSQLTQNDFLGTYAGRAAQTDCIFELHLDKQALLAGRFEAEGEALMVDSANFSKTGQVYGLLLEPFERTAIAAFRATLEADGLVLELDAPDSGEPADFSTAEPIRFAKISDLVLEFNALSGEGFRPLGGGL